MDTGGVNEDERSSRISDWRQHVPRFLLYYFFYDYIRYVFFTNDLHIASFTNAFCGSENTIIGNMVTFETCEWGEYVEVTFTICVLWFILYSRCCLYLELFLFLAC